MDPNAPNPYPAAGEVIDGKYKIEKMLGEGGMGAVARATHVVLGGTLAIKFMNPQFMTFPGAVERFVNEGRASKAIKSDHVLPVNEIGLLPNGAPYLLMDCLYGLDLADLLARDGPSGLPVERAVHFVVQILRGLQAAHAINIIHRDMKPANCFVITNDGEDDWVKILDFGISKVKEAGSQSLTQTNSALGTPLYMSPEQARSPRDVDHRSDIYSVGVILYELLCGRTPFFSESGEFTEILFQLFTADPPPLKSLRPDVPDDLAAVTHKALAREVVDRYSNALELAEALVPFASPRTVLMVERMRKFTPPRQVSIAPGGAGLPTSMDALSQLRGHSTEHMANRPTTDIQKSAPVTEILEPPPTPRKNGKQDKTAYLPASPASEAEVAAKAGVSTDLGAAVDRPVAPAVETKRSPMVYAMPMIAALIIGAVVVALTLKPGGSDKDKKDNASNNPPPSATTSIPVDTTPTPTPSNALVAQPQPSASVSAAPPLPSVTNATPLTTKPYVPPTSAKGVMGTGLRE